MKKFKKLGICKIWDIVVCTAIVVWGICFLNRLCLPYVVDDEFGYWMSGAYFAGYDWSSVSNKISYYSYAYGLLLACALRIFTSVVAYRVMAFINIIWLIGIYFVLIKLLKIVCKREDIVCHIVAFFGVTYTNNIVQSKLTWPEVCGYFVFGIIVYLMYKVFTDTANFYEYGLLAFLTVLLFAIHQRYVGVLVATLLSLFVYAVVNRKENKKNIVFFIIVFVIMFLINFFLKGRYQEDIWGNNTDAMNINDFSGGFNKIKTALSSDGIRNVLLTAMGQIYYSCVATFGISILGITFLIIRVKETFKAKERVSLWYIYIIISYLGMLAIGAIFLQDAYTNNSRVDYLLYGRYTENISSILICFGIVFIMDCYKNRNSIVHSLYVGVVIFTTIWGCVVSLISQEQARTDYNMISSIGGGIYWNDFEYKWYIPILIMISMLVAYWVACFGNRIKKIATIIVILVAGSVSMLTTSKMVNGVLNVGNSNLPCVEAAEKIAEYSTYPIYYLTEKNVWKDRKKNNIQFLLKDIKVTCISRTQLYFLQRYSKNIVITSADNPYIYFLILKGYEIEFESEDIVVLKIEDNTKDQEIISPKFEFYGTEFEFDKDSMKTISNDGKEGYVCYGPDIKVPYGTYSISIKLHAEGELQNDVGYIALMDNERVLELRGIAKEDFTDFTANIVLDHVLTKGSNAFNIRIYAKENNYIEVEPPIITRNNELYFDNLDKNMYTTMLEGYPLQEKDKDGTVLRRIKRPISQTIKIIPDTLFYGTDFETDSEGRFVSVGDKQGFLCYGPYISVPKGNYRISFDISAENLEEQDKGYIAVYNDEELITLQGIDAKEFEGNELTIDIDFELPSGSQSLYYYVYSKSESKLIVNQISIQRTFEKNTYIKIYERI